MAIIYSYPKVTPTTADLLIGTLVSDDSGENPTKSFSIADIIGLVPAAGTGGTVTSIGLTNADGFLTIGNSPITTAGNTGSTFIGINATTPTAPIISLSATGTPSATSYLRGDNTWATIAGGGSMSSWNIAAGTGTPEQVDEAETVTIAGGTGITTAVAATNTVTVTNSGVTSVTATAPIVTSGATGAITLTAPDVLTNTAQVSAQAKITSVISLTAAEYAAIGAGNYDANTLYVVI